MCCCSTIWGLTMCKLQPLGGFIASSQAPGRTLWTKGLFLAVLACFHKYNSEKGLITGNLLNLIETDFSLGFCFCVTHRYHQQLYWVGKKGELANRLWSENGAFQITFLWHVNVLESTEKLKRKRHNVCSPKAVMTEKRNKERACKKKKQNQKTINQRGYLLI